MQTHNKPGTLSLEVLVCQTRRLGMQAQCCGKRGSPEVLDALRRLVDDGGLDVRVMESPCLGHCSVGPNVRIVGDALFHEVSEETLGTILERLRSLASRRDEPAEGDRPSHETLPPV